ncbi:4-alpha-glucanotransferase [Telmatospirillum sp. J64-1]|uniref:4-alpha-glucanotransferase n=1 Tax=Telmatospirillum sp. J64-1 TaxID=2502183 RepID=UPI00115F2678|nr:4-alpha-glucanotransferase [Telmatospirillum sp. J64-1]
MADGGGTTALDRLAGRMGIEAEYVNAMGKTVTTPAETKRKLLAVMGLKAEDEQAARQSLEELEAREAARPLPPVMVLRETARPFSIPLSLPGKDGRLRWTVRLEEGGEESGEDDLSDRLDIEAALPCGYHLLVVEWPGDQAEMPLIVAPERCWLPDGFAEGKQRLWGISAQLYLLRAATAWGIGDFTELKTLVELAANRGAAVIGLNPLHAMFLDNPDHASPYSPASRLFLNVLYIDHTAIPDFMECEEAQRLMASDDFQALLAAVKDAPLVDYDAVTELKLRILEPLFEHFIRHAPPERQAAFDSFRREQGRPLEQLCVFQALREHMSAQAPDKAGWQNWPEDFRDHASPAIADFAARHRQRIDFLAWCQWIADTQLAQAAAHAREKGMVIGLYRDLAVGADTSGAETWSNPHVALAGAHVGAPPDIFNPAGQDWGLPPFNPHALREEGYAGFIALVRANMRHAGGLRIDHAMALQHTYWVPAGETPKAGAYVTYPMEDMLGILALESQRHRCIVVGEDLGTVPEGFRERMAKAHILSYRVLFFEQDGENGAFVPPRDYPVLSLATIGSHDLPTLRSWWDGSDIDQKAALGLYPEADEAERQHERRRRDRQCLLDALRKEGLAQGDEREMTDKLAMSIHAFLARSRSGIAMIQLDDLTDEADPVNIPGATHQYPVWRRKMSRSLEEIGQDARFAALIDAVKQQRGAVDD